MVSNVLQNFSIGEDKLISLAKHMFETQSGQKDHSVLSDDFRFEFPIVSLDKKVLPHCCLSSVMSMNMTARTAHQGLP